MIERLQPVIEELPRTITDGLPKIRSWAGPIIAEYLDETPPEERHALDGLMVAALGGTDKLDGFLARLIGPTEYGQKLDKEADVNFIVPGQAALANNGEVPRIHYALKGFREHSIAIGRKWAASQGLSTKSSAGGQRKTFFEMKHLAEAASPLAQNSDLMRWGAAAGTGFSMDDLLDTLFRYRREYRLKQQTEDDKTVATARNSEARRLTASPIERVAGLVHRYAPGLKPTHITKAGKLMVEAADLLALASPDRATLATVIYTAGSLLDTLDGAYARLIGEDSLEGMKDDVKADLEQQIFTFATLSLIARRCGNKVASANYAIATMTTALSAFYRAEAESMGFIVGEGGMGTRVGRGIMAGIGMKFNKHQDASDIVSAMIAAGNFNTIQERRQVVAKGLKSPYCLGVNHEEDFKLQAKERRQAILPYAVAGLAIGSLLWEDSVRRFE